MVAIIIAIILAQTDLIFEFNRTFWIKVQKKSPRCRGPLLVDMRGKMKFTAVSSTLK